jgi:mersacidin/lichenicidin family type 2 lantibiotic
MSKRNIIRAWKDESYRHSLSAAERAGMPQNPAGAIELGEKELHGVAGGGWLTIQNSVCVCYTVYIACHTLYPWDCPIPNTPACPQ